MRIIFRFLEVLKGENEKSFVFWVGHGYRSDVPAPRSARRPRSAPPPPPPRQFRQLRARASYEKILEAARGVFGERGFHAAQTPDIAARAGMSVGGLYRYFRDKHQIFLEMVHRDLEENRLRQDAMIVAFEAAWAEGSIDLAQGVDWIVDWTWSEIHNAPASLLRTYLAMSYEDETFAALSEQYDRYERQALARVLEKVVDTSRIPSALAAARAIDLVVPMLAMWSALHPGAESRGLQEAARQMVYRFLAPPDTTDR